MKASELVKHLQDSIAKYGDHPIVLMEGTNQVDCRGIVHCKDQEETVEHFLIADDNTFDAFCDNSDDPEDDGSHGGSPGDE